MENFDRKHMHERRPIDELAKAGHFQQQDLPGSDTYDEGLIEGRGLVPNLTTTESGGTYMEDKGPANLVSKASDTHDALAGQSGLRISEDETSIDEIDGTVDDPAARWLRENDPDLKKSDSGSTIH